MREKRQALPSPKAGLKKNEVSHTSPPPKDLIMSEDYLYLTVLQIEVSNNSSKHRFGASSVKCNRYLLRLPLLSGWPITQRSVLLQSTGHITVLNSWS